MGGAVIWTPDDSTTSKTTEKAPCISLYSLHTYPLPMSTEEMGLKVPASQNIDHVLTLLWLVFHLHLCGRILMVGKFKKVMDGQARTKHPSVP